jgi:hypothetical protein
MYENNASYYFSQTTLTIVLTLYIYIYMSQVNPTSRRAYIPQTPLHNQHASPTPSYSQCAGRDKTFAEPSELFTRAAFQLDGVMETAALWRVFRGS